MLRLLGIAGVLCIATTARAEDEPEENAQSQEQRIQDLERKNRDLEERLERLEGDGTGLPEPDPLAEDIEGYLAEEGLGLNLVVRRGNVHGVFQLFGDVGVRYDNPEISGRSNTFFFNGTLDLFFTARAGDNFHVLSETVFLNSLGEPRDGSDFDQERLWGAWRFSDFIQIKLGLEHGPISRWNQQFHHGRWLEMTVQRPLLARFEGDGGILPMHNAGVEFSGTVPTRFGLLNYVVFVSNGRGRVATDTQEFSDRNDGKAFDVGLGFRPESLPDLWVGAFFRIDDIPANPTDVSRLRSIREVIASFQTDYRGERLSILFEVIYLENRDRQSMSAFGHYAAYLQIAYQVDDQWTPYVRIDFREMEQGDPYFSPLDRDLDVWELLFGVRYDLLANASIKFEIGFGENERRSAASVVSTGTYIRIGFQLAWVF